jgi:hypothetical protein
METTARDGSQTYGCRISFVPRLWTEHKELNKKIGIHGEVHLFIQDHTRESRVWRVLLVTEFG